MGLLCLEEGLGEEPGRLVPPGSLEVFDLQGIDPFVNLRKSMVLYTRKTQIPIAFCVQFYSKRFRTQNTIYKPQVKISGQMNMYLKRGPPDSF